MNEEIPSPSYRTAALCGFLVGMLAGCVLLFFESAQWPVRLLVPAAAGLAGALLGAYVAAEAYDDLRAHYDAERNVAGTDERTREKIEALRERMAREATRLAQEASGMGADGYKIAEAAEILRREAAFLSRESD